MRLFKLITSGLVAALVLLFIKQNLSAFRTKVAFSLDLFIREPVGWEHSVYGLMIFSAGVGFLLGVLVLLRPYVRARRLLAEGRTEKREPETRFSPDETHAHANVSEPPPQN